MRTSPANSGSAGFTLVEVMTALFVVSIAASAVVLMAPGPDSRLRDAAERLAARLQAAGEASVLANRTIALVVSSEGYRFDRQEERGWRELPNDSALAFRPWPEGVTARIVAPKPDDAAGMRVAEFDPLGGATPLDLQLEDGATAWSVTIGNDGGIDARRAR
ncbi:MAG: GspH/FimT family pseudopilin [Hyphomonadaceae bacterium]|jgi:type II secretion system protein H